MKNVFKKFKENFNAARESEQGDIVQTILIIVIFVVIVVAVGAMLWNAIQGQANRVSNCIASANPVGNNNQSCN